MNSAIECLFHGLFPFSSRGFAGGMNRLGCSRPSCWRWSRSGWPGWWLSCVDDAGVVRVRPTGPLQTTTNCCGVDTLRVRRLAAISAISSAGVDDGLLHLGLTVLKYDVGGRVDGAAQRIGVLPGADGVVPLEHEARRVDLGGVARVAGRTRGQRLRGRALGRVVAGRRLHLDERRVRVADRDCEHPLRDERAAQDRARRRRRGRRCSGTRRGSGTRAAWSRPASSSSASWPSRSRRRCGRCPS